MLAIDEAKLPPPKPATVAAASSRPYGTPGYSTAAANRHGTSSRAALTIVQLRPPNFVTANVYGSRSSAPTAVGSVVSRNFPAGSTWYSGPRKSTNTDHRLHTEKPTCSDMIEKTRFRRAPVVDPVPACGWHQCAGRTGSGWTWRGDGDLHGGTSRCRGVPTVRA